MNEMVYYNLKGATTITSILSVQIAREIGRRIIIGSITVGEKLDDEFALALHYRVSRSVIRDALKILLNKGLLDVKRSIGTIVKPRSEWRMLDDDILAWHLSIPIEKCVEHLIPLMETRLTFETKAAVWAANKATDEELVNIGNAYQDIAKSIKDFDSLVIAEAKFIRAILHASHNEFLYMMEGITFTSMLLSARLFGTTIISHTMYEELYNAIRNKHSIRAQEISESIIMQAIQAVSESDIESVA